ncbi:alpha/beta hydrolase [Inhella sp.]|uniref:alpha/beta hydrolase n=1 Tax=Inhella sp. TaxID=1921806 RepID=UPI0035B1430A
MKIARRLAALGLLGYLLLCLLVFGEQRRLLYHPNPEPLALGPSIGATTLALQAADGEKLVAWWLPPPRPEAPVVLYLHGNGANLDNRAARLKALHEDGAGVLALSWRGYGGSSGQPSEAGWKLDAQAAYDWLRAQPVAPKRIVLFGESLGSTQAVMLAAAQPVGALLLDSSFDSALALAGGHYPWLPISWLMRDPHRADLAAPQVAVPVLQVHCAQDPVSPLAHAQALNRLLPNARLQVLQEPCHVPSYAKYRESARAFLREPG